MIYAIGDSFTEGGELPGQYWGVPGKGAWPEVLENLIQKPVINKGRSASGNTRIIKKAIDAVYSDATGIIICWTSPDRIEMIDKAGIYDIWPGRNLWWITDDPQKQHRLELLKYLTLYHGEFENLLYDYKNFLRQIILIQNLCKNNNVRCSMLLAFGARENAEMFHYDSSVQKLLKCIDFSMFVRSTIEESTVDWTNGTPKMPKGHPGPEGHSIIANEVYQNIIQNDWFESTK